MSRCECVICKGIDLMLKDLDDDEREDIVIEFEESTVLSKADPTTKTVGVNLRGLFRESGRRDASGRRIFSRIS